MGHIHEKIDFTASVYVVFKNKILLHKHKKLNIWLPPGGHIELDEDPNQAAVREAKEESGLDVELVGKATSHDSLFRGRDLIPPHFLNRHYFDDSHTHEHIDLGYLARTNTDVVQHEVDGGEIRWFTRKEIERNEIDLLPDIQIHALAALDALME